MTPLLEAQNLAFSFNSKDPFLRDITLSVCEGDSVGMVGANGAGKSTLLWCLLGLHRASGKLRAFGGKLDKRSVHRIGVVFQNPEDQLFMPSVLEDITLPLTNRGMTPEAAGEKAAKVLEQVGLNTAAGGRTASKLSLGERKRASIAAALACSPELLVLDEPTAELDGKAIRRLTEVLRSLPVAKLIASHNLDFLRQVTSRVLVLHEGRIAAEGSTQDLLDDESLLERVGLL